MSVIDIAGKRFGRLFVKKFVDTKKGGGARWKCVCDCGKVVTVRSQSLRTGQTTSCGCYRRERMSYRASGKAGEICDGEKLCRKSLKAKNGEGRGTCMRRSGHNGGHGTKTTCRDCAVRLTKDNSVSYCPMCRDCRTNYQRATHGSKPLNRQMPGKKHTFLCGCSGILPKQRRQPNKFAVAVSSNWACRAAIILKNSKFHAKKYKPMDSNTPHSLIRELMEEPNCERCGQPLKWELGVGRTPHLHHDHDTGEIYGFTHLRCNSQALENEIERLKAKIKKLTAKKIY
jgi:hypothetical protein